MGNRAVITTKAKEIGVYLHWNGGRDSVEGFLEYCKRAGFRGLDEDSYGFARLVQVVANFFGAGGLSVGVAPFKSLDCDNGDNGVYIVKGWEIVGREFAPPVESKEYNLEEFVAQIGACQPKEEDRPS